MLEKIFCIFGSIKTRKYLFIVLLFFPGFAGIDTHNFVSAQPLPNLDVFYKLADSSVVNLVNTLSPEAKSLFIKHSLVNDYLIFQNRIIAGIKKGNRDILTTGDSARAEVVYAIESAKVKYSDMYKDGLFGDYKIKRELTLKGNFLVSEQGSLRTQKTFIYTSDDTINYDDIANVENSSIPFTRGDVPAEPFFSSLIEPAIAVGSAAVAVYLFFHVRSK